MSIKRSSRKRVAVASVAAVVALVGIGSYTMASAANPWRGHDRSTPGRSTPTSSSTAGSTATAMAKPSSTASSTTTATPAETSSSATDSEVTLPPADGQFDYQIGGAYTPASSVQIVDRDREAEPAQGKYNICYVNAFQTQPGDADFWTGSHEDLLLKKNGKLFEDADWPGEYLIDTSTAANREALADIVGEWIDGCAAAGFDAVEPDNLDTYTRSDKLLTKAGNLAFAALLADRAHDAGLAIAQKNTAELDRSDAETAGFDFAVAEECQAWDECDAYTDIYGDQVYEIEYTDNDESAYTQACQAQGEDISVILRDRDVVPSDDSAYHYENC
ncbi:endo alpha-1,4 polygalactosaminidase [Kineosporia sp. J2-2]|uniref:Endo alpha-1,4 polygalactosaminidase n=1 Tax=Kineosporia corallincola TaxID=2835133 RepID=A0ABS5TME5_9ACTN|nr:endo alpha-1,4 polygalactosaminidase [Kineosporia corallincola]MBT0772278.1 endo alpha-1,4 polygalactosaminidase [Kineosporia corallincola]